MSTDTRIGLRIGLLGGTLDPIHAGHIETARAAQRALELDRILVLPSGVPPHRQHQPEASPYHRFAMTALAINGIDRLEAGDAELCAPGPSYTADTLVRLRASTGLPATQIFFITGADAFAEIETWHRYPEVLDLSHFVVVSRPGFPAASMKTRLPALASRMVPATPAAKCSGAAAVFLVEVLTPDVSSTEIRRRLRAKASLSGLVPDAVAAHIRKHRLYMNDTLSTTATHLHDQH